MCRSLETHLSSFLGRWSTVRSFSVSRVLFFFFYRRAKFVKQRVNIIWDHWFVLLYTDDIIWPDGEDALPADAQDLITRLLRQNPVERLGTGWWRLSSVTGYLLLWPFAHFLSTCYVVSPDIRRIKRIKERYFQLFLQNKRNNHVNGLSVKIICICSSFRTKDGLIHY